MAAGAPARVAAGGLAATVVKLVTIVNRAQAPTETPILRRR